MERGGAQQPDGEGGDVFEDLASWPALASTTSARTISCSVNSPPPPETTIPFSSRVHYLLMWGEETT